MARNVEIKARIENMEHTCHLAAKVATRGPEFVDQTDTFFRVNTGRLKLREFSDATAELIRYERPDSVEPTESVYERLKVEDANALLEMLGAAIGIRGTVKKRRTVYWVGRTRLHLDEVVGLGNFLELEVVMDSEESLEQGVREATELMKKLEVPETSLIPVAYVDMLD